MVALKFNYIFVARILLKKHLGVRRLNKVILLPSGEKRRNKAFINVVNRLQIVYVEISSTFY